MTLRFIGRNRAMCELTPKDRELASLWCSRFNIRPSQGKDQFYRWPEEVPASVSKFLHESYRSLDKATDHMAEIIRDLRESLGVYDEIRSALAEQKQKIVAIVKQTDFEMDPYLHDGEGNYNTLVDEDATKRVIIEKILNLP